MRRLTVRRFAAILLAGGGLVALSIPRVGYAAAPDVRIVTPANIDIDGSNGDWDSQSKDFLAEMYKAGNPDKEILAKFFGRYDCDTKTFYAHVVTVSNWTILPSDNDNYVKLGQSDKLVDGNDGTGGGPPDFAYIGVKAWEASFKLAPGSYLGDGGLNVHAEVQPENRADTAAVAGRRLDVIINCPKPTPTPEPTATPTPPPTPTAPPTAPPTEPPDAVRVRQRGAVRAASEAPSGSEAPSASASEAPSRPPARCRRRRRARSHRAASPRRHPPASRRPSRRRSRARSPARAASPRPARARRPRRARRRPRAWLRPRASHRPSPPPSRARSRARARLRRAASNRRSPQARRAATAPELTAPPLVVAKVDDKGTSTRDDDRLDRRGGVRGADRRRRRRVRARRRRRQRDRRPRVTQGVLGLSARWPRRLLGEGGPAAGWAGDRRRDAGEVPDPGDAGELLRGRRQEALPGRTRTTRAGTPSRSSSTRRSAPRPRRSARRLPPPIRTPWRPVRRPAMTRCGCSSWSSGRPPAPPTWPARRPGGGPDRTQLCRRTRSTRTVR